MFEAAFDGQAIGRPVLGSEKTVRSVTRQDCFDWLARQFTPSRLVLSASGKVDADRVLRLAEKLFGDMETPTNGALVTFVVVSVAVLAGCMAIRRKLGK